MNILILEDDPYRIEKFRLNLIGCNLDVTKDPQEANRWLKEKEYDYIFLDHDLEDIHYMEDCLSKETTGLCVADFIGQNPTIQQNAKIHIHSMNPAGSARMQRAINRYVTTTPFHLLFK